MACNLAGCQGRSLKAMQTKRACFGQRAEPPRTGIDAVAETSLELVSDPLSLVRLTSLSVKQQALRTCCKQLFEGNRQALSNKLSRSIWMGRDVTAMKCLVTRGICRVTESHLGQKKKGCYPLSESVLSNN